MTDGERGRATEKDPPSHRLHDRGKERHDAREQEEGDGGAAERHRRESPVDGAEREPGHGRDDEPRNDPPSPGSRPHQRFGRGAALGLTLTRLLLGPGVLLIAALGGDGRILGAVVVVATLTDIFDGKVARRFGVATAELRRLDSIADTIFYAGAGIALWLRHADVLRASAPLLIAFLAMQVGGHLLDVWKFGRDTSYHTWSGRAFGVALCIAVTLVFWTGHGGGWLNAALIVGMVAHLDACAITMILPSWHHDVHTIRNAVRIRRDSESRT